MKQKQIQGSNEDRTRTWWKRALREHQRGHTSSRLNGGWRRGGTGVARWHPHFPLLFGSFCTGNCARCLWTGLRQGTPAPVLHFCLTAWSQQKQGCVCYILTLANLNFRSPWTLSWNGLIFIKLHCSFISFTLWNPNIASIPLLFLNLKLNTFLIKMCYSTILQKQMWWYSNRCETTNVQKALSK